MTFEINLDTEEYQNPWSQKEIKEKQKNKEFISVLFQSIYNQRDQWINQQHLILITNAVSVLASEDLQLESVAKVLSVIETVFQNDQKGLNDLLSKCLWKGVKIAQFIEKLLKMGAQLDGADSSIFFNVVVNGSQELIELLYAHGSYDLKQVILSHVIRLKKPPVLNALISKGIDINKIAIEGEKLLHFAISQGSLEIVEILLTDGADISALDSKGFSSLQIAANSTKDSQGIVKTLLDRGAEVKPTEIWNQILYVAYKNNHEQLVLKLLEQEKQAPQKTFKNLEKILWRACYNGDEKLAGLLLNMNISTLHIENGVTCCGVAKMQGHERCVNLFPIDEKTETLIWIKTISHYLALKDYCNEELQFKSGETFPLKGAWTPHMSKTIAEFLSIYCWKDNTLLSKEQKKELETAFKEASVFRDADALYSSFDQEKLVILPCGWLGHAISLVFYKDFMVVCNRGNFGNKYTIHPFKINRNKLTKKCLETILLQCKNEQLDFQAIPFFYDELPRTLSPYEDGHSVSIENDQTCRLMATLMSSKYQKAPNCTLATLMLALRTAIFLLGADKQEIPLELYQRATQEAKKFSLASKFYYYHKFHEFRAKKIQKGKYLLTNESDVSFLLDLSDKMKELSTKYPEESIKEESSTPILDTCLKATLKMLNAMKTIFPWTQYATSSSR